MQQVDNLNEYVERLVVELVGKALMGAVEDSLILGVLEDKGAVQEPAPHYINYVLTEYNDSPNTVNWGMTRNTYTIGPYPKPIAQYLVRYWIPTLNKATVGAYSYTSRVTMSLRPRKYSTLIEGPTVEEIRALVDDKLDDSIREHTMAYLYLQDM